MPDFLSGFVATVYLDVYYIPFVPYFVKFLSKKIKKSISNSSEILLFNVFHHSDRYRHRQKHYWVGSDEVDKLLRLGEDWLPNHPEKAYITGRYLNRKRSPVNMAFEQLAAANVVDGEILSDETEETEKKEDKA